MDFSNFPDFGFFLNNGQGPPNQNQWAAPNGNNNLNQPPVIMPPFPSFPEFMRNFPNGPPQDMPPPVPPVPPPHLPIRSAASNDAFARNSALSGNPQGQQASARTNHAGSHYKPQNANNWRPHDSRGSQARKNNTFPRAKPRANNPKPPAGPKKQSPAASRVASRRDADKEEGELSESESLLSDSAARNSKRPRLRSPEDKDAVRGSRMTSAPRDQASHKNAPLGPSKLQAPIFHEKPGTQNRNLPTSQSSVGPYGNKADESVPTTSNAFHGFEKERQSGKRFLHLMLDNGYGHSDLVKQGLNPVLLNKLYHEAGIPTDQPQVGPSQSMKPTQPKEPVLPAATLSTANPVQRPPRKETNAVTESDSCQKPNLVGNKPSTTTSSSKPIQQSVTKDLPPKAAVAPTGPKLSQQAAHKTLSAPTDPEPPQQPAQKALAAVTATQQMQGTAAKESQPKMDRGEYLARLAAAKTKKPVFKDSPRSVITANSQPNFNEPSTTTTTDVEKHTKATSEAHTVPNPASKPDQQANSKTAVEKVAHPSSETKVGSDTVGKPDQPSMPDQTDAEKATRTNPDAGAVPTVASQSPERETDKKDKSKTELIRLRLEALKSAKASADAKKSKEASVETSPALNGMPKFLAPPLPKATDGPADLSSAPRSPKQNPAAQGNVAPTQSDQYAEAQNSLSLPSFADSSHTQSKSQPATEIRGTTPTLVAPKLGLVNDKGVSTEAPTKESNAFQGTYPISKTSSGPWHSESDDACIIEASDDEIDNETTSRLSPALQATAMASFNPSMARANTDHGQPNDLKSREQQILEMKKKIELYEQKQKAKALTPKPSTPGTPLATDSITTNGPSDPKTLDQNTMFTQQSAIFVATNAEHPAVDGVTETTVIKKANSPSSQLQQQMNSEFDGDKDQQQRVLAKPSDRHNENGRSSYAKLCEKLSKLRIPGLLDRGDDSLAKLDISLPSPDAPSATSMSISASSDQSASSSPGLNSNQADRDMKSTRSSHGELSHVDQAHPKSMLVGSSTDNQAVAEQEPSNAVNTSSSEASEESSSVSDSGAPNSNNASPKSPVQVAAPDTRSALNERHDSNLNNTEVEHDDHGDIRMSESVSSPDQPNFDGASRMEVDELINDVLKSMASKNPAPELTDSQEEIIGSKVTAPALKSEDQWPADLLVSPVCFLRLIVLFAKSGSGKTHVRRGRSSSPIRTL